jgi:hypothetical protein
MADSAVSVSTLKAAAAEALRSAYHRVAPTASASASSRYSSSRGHAQRPRGCAGAPPTTESLWLLLDLDGRGVYGFLATTQLPRRRQLRSQGSESARPRAPLAPLPIAEGPRQAAVSNPCVKFTTPLRSYGLWLTTCRSAASGAHHCFQLPRCQHAILTQIASNAMRRFIVSLPP